MGEKENLQYVSVISRSHAQGTSRDRSMAVSAPLRKIAPTLPSEIMN